MYSLSVLWSISDNLVGAVPGYNVSGAWSGTWSACCRVRVRAKIWRLCTKACFTHVILSTLLSPMMWRDVVFCRFPPSTNMLSTIRRFLAAGLPSKSSPKPDVLLHPAGEGDILNQRYSIKRRLGAGFGTRSTIWLSKDSVYSLLFFLYDLVLLS